MGGEPSIRLIDIDDPLRRAVEEAPDEFVAKYGAALGQSGPVIRGVVAQTMDLLRRAPRAPQWGGYLSADVRRALVIGTCGYARGPDGDGTVEIAYFTLPEFEGRGYATAMARELLRRALRSPEVAEVVAHTLPERNASARVLEKVGLRRAGEAQDPEVGRVWRWSYRPGV